MHQTTTAHKRVDIRHNDTVKVIKGRDRGKQGRVLRVLPDEGKILVEHVMM
ncbi:MAG TPA: KOW motif domain-containing protein, partial [Terriglobales bacterium]